jgi:hypothetical protein
MTINTQEHQDIVSQFDRESKGARLDKEPKSIWLLGRIYQDGHVNEQFLAYRRGYALAKSVYQIGAVDRRIPPDWAESANSARGLCESEARRWETMSPKTAEHWHRVATHLGALYLTQDHLTVAAVTREREDRLLDLIADCIPYTPEGIATRQRISAVIAEYTEQAAAAVTRAQEGEVERLELGTLSAARAVFELWEGDCQFGHDLDKFDGAIEALKAMVIASEALSRLTALDQPITPVPAAPSSDQG